MLTSTFSIIFTISFLALYTLHIHFVTQNTVGNPTICECTNRNNDYNNPGYIFNSLLSLQVPLSSTNTPAHLVHSPITFWLLGWHCSQFNMIQSVIKHLKLYLHSYILANKAYQNNHDQNTLDYKYNYNH